MTIKRRLIIAFIILILAVTSITLIGFFISQKATSTYDRLNKTIEPSHELLKKYRFINTRLKLIWSKEESLFELSNYDDLNKIKEILEVEIPNLNAGLLGIKMEFEQKFPELKLNTEVITLGEQIIELSSVIIENNEKLKIADTNTENFDRLNRMFEDLEIYISKEERMLRDESIRLSENLENSLKLYSKVFLIIGTITVLFFLIILFNLLHSIARPLETLQLKIKQIIDGNLGVEISIEGPRELKELGDSFSEMSETLQDSFEEIKEKNIDLLKTTEKLQEFVYIASHDLKTPLRGLSNIATFLQEDYGNQLDEEGIKMVKNVQNQAERMTILINDLLEYSKLDNVNINTESFALKDVVNNVIELLEIQKDDKIDVEVKDLPEIKLDKSLIHTVFNNLISNGIKYNNSERKEIKIWCDGNNVFVRDNGIGISNEDLPKIFNFFERLHNTNEYGGGSGAGLTIVKKVLERHEISIDVESEVGVGTTFILNFEDCIESM